MDQFSSLKDAFKMSSLFKRKPDTRMDIVSNLPPEVATLIFRFLDDSSLIASMNVGSYWGELCTSDPILCKRIIAYLKDEENRSQDASSQANGIRRIAKNVCQVLFKCSCPRQNHYV